MTKNKRNTCKKQNYAGSSFLQITLLYSSIFQFACFIRNICVCLASLNSLARWFFCLIMSAPVSGVTFLMISTMLMVVQASHCTAWLTKNKISERLLNQNIYMQKIREWAQSLFFSTREALCHLHTCSPDLDLTDWFRGCFMPDFRFLISILTDIFNFVTQ